MNSVGDSFILGTDGEKIYVKSSKTPEEVLVLTDDNTSYISSHSKELEEIFFIEPKQYLINEEMGIKSFLVTIIALFFAFIGSWLYIRGGKNEK